jgi:hypothetical protein
MAGMLTDDEQFQATTFHVIDFETTTPRGYRPEPIEVAVTPCASRPASSPKPHGSRR